MQTLSGETKSSLHLLVAAHTEINATMTLCFPTVPLYPQPCLPPACLLPRTCLVQVVRLERVTAGYVAMCSRRTYLQENLKETLEAKKAQAKVRARVGPIEPRCGTAYI